MNEFFFSVLGNWLDPMGAQVAADIASQTVTIVVAAVIGGIIVRIRALSDRQRKQEQESKDAQKAQAERSEALEHAVKSLLRSSIIHDVDRGFDRGWMSDTDRQSISQSHRDYESLNGPNGLIDSYMERLAALPMHPSSGGTA